jgi:hypothetical protein
MRVFLPCQLQTHHMIYHGEGIIVINQPADDPDAFCAINPLF